MRRQDREIRGRVEILAVMDKCKICRLGLWDIDKEEVYVVPLSFGYVFEQDVLILYFHGAAEGRKLDIMRKNPSVGFEMDSSHIIREGKTACEATCSFKSIIGQGTAEIVEDAEEKRKGLEVLMRCQTGHDYPIDEKMAKVVTIWKVTAEQFTGKFHE